MISSTPTDRTRCATSMMIKRTAAAPSIAFKVVADVNPQPRDEANSVAGAALLISTVNATPQVAPAVTPNTDESATGFRNSVCICRPATPSEPPTIIAVIVRGILISQTMVFQASLLLSCARRILSSSEIGISTDPRAIPSSTSTTRIGAHNRNTK